MAVIVLPVLKAIAIRDYLRRFWAVGSFEIAATKKVSVWYHLAK